MRLWTKLRLLRHQDIICAHSIETASSKKEKNVGANDINEYSELPKSNHRHLTISRQKARENRQPEILGSNEQVGVEGGGSIHIYSLKE